MTPSKIFPMASTSGSLPRYMLRSDPREFYGLPVAASTTINAEACWHHPMPPAQQDCSGHNKHCAMPASTPSQRWRPQYPSTTTWVATTATSTTSTCAPPAFGYFIGWTSPSAIGLVQSGKVAQWHRVRECARYDGPGVYETSTAAPSVQAHLDALAAATTPTIAVYLLEEQPLAFGRIRVSATSKTAGLQCGRLLVRDGHRVGAPGAWLDLPHMRSTAELSEYRAPHPRRRISSTAALNRWTLVRLSAATSRCVREIDTGPGYFDPNR